jgi:hypothetical protein
MPHIARTEGTAIGPGILQLLKARDNGSKKPLLPAVRPLVIKVLNFCEGSSIY